MQGKEMRAIRERLGMTELQLARALGYTGTDRNDDTRIREYERGKKQIPLYVARLVWLIGEIAERAEINSNHGVPNPGYVADDFLPDWPEWPGYDFDHSPDSEVAK